MSPPTRGKKNEEENMRHKMSSSTVERLLRNATVNNNRNWKRKSKQTGKKKQAETRKRRCPSRSMHPSGADA
jgi:hypothetical protein